MWVGFSEWQKKKVKIYLSHVNIHQKVIIVEENFINQVEGWPILWISISLFPRSPIIDKGTHEPDGHGDSDGGYTWAQQHRLTFNQHWLQPLLSVQYASSRYQYRVSDMVPFSRVINQLPHWLHCTDFIMEGAMPCSYWNGHLFWVGVCLPTYKTSVKLPSVFV